MTDREKMIDLIINAKKSDPETGSFTEYLADFLLGYGVKLPTPTPQPGKPLTLDQLQEMDGKPVWIVEYPDWGHWELSEDAEDYLCDRDTDLYGFMSDLDGEAGFHELGWLAYPYPPAHIDRSEWISVKERLPSIRDDGIAECYLISDGNLIHMAYYVTGEWRFCESGQITEPMFYEVTYWMPLPEPPEEG